MRWPGWITGHSTADRLRQQAEDVLRQEVEQHKLIILDRLHELSDMVASYEPPAYRRLSTATRDEIEAYRASILERLHDLEEREVELGKPATE